MNSANKAICYAEVINMILMSNDENVRPCKRQPVVHQRSVFGDRFALPWPCDSLP